jgi:hypothetical protein
MGVAIHEIESLKREMSWMENGGKKKKKKKNKFDFII